MFCYTMSYNNLNTERTPTYVVHNHGKLNHRPACYSPSVKRLPSLRKVIVSEKHTHYFNNKTSSLCSSLLALKQKPAQLTPRCFFSLANSWASSSPQLRPPPASPVLLTALPSLQEAQWLWHHHSTKTAGLETVTAALHSVPSDITTADHFPYGPFQCHLSCTVSGSLCGFSAVFQEILALLRGRTPSQNFSTTLSEVRVWTWAYLPIKEFKFIPQSPAAVKDSEQPGIQLCEDTIRGKNLWEAMWLQPKARITINVKKHKLKHILLSTSYFLYINKIHIIKSLSHECDTESFLIFSGECQLTFLLRGLS